MRQGDVTAEASRWSHARLQGERLTRVVGLAAGSDSPESAKEELGLVFEGWDVDWWLAQQDGREPGAPL